jgi:hypothetical protein
MSPLSPPRRQWTAEERKKLDDLLEAGKTGPEIATALQRTPHSIYSQLQRLDIKRKSHPPPSRDWAARFLLARLAF